jgi:hypothetical protein
VSELFTTVEQQDFFHGEPHRIPGDTVERSPNGKIENDGGRVPMSLRRSKHCNGKTDLIYTHE